MRFYTLVICAIATLASACASSNAVPRPFPGSPKASTPVPPPVWRGPGDTTASTTPPALAPEPTISSTPLPSDGLTARRYDGRAVAEYALAFRGVPYKFGGANPDGFDCSGLVQYVFGQYGVYVPRVVDEQWEVGDKIRVNDIKPGDLLFFSTKGPHVSHVGIALDTDRFIHAPNSTGVVRVETLSSTYWAAHYLGARRVNKPATTN